MKFIHKKQEQTVNILKKILPFSKSKGPGGIVVFPLSCYSPLTGAIPMHGVYLISTSSIGAENDMQPVRWPARIFIGALIGQTGKIFSGQIYGIDIQLSPSS